MFAIGDAVKVRETYWGMELTGVVVEAGVLVSVEHDKPKNFDQHRLVAYEFKRHSSVDPWLWYFDGPHCWQETRLQHYEPDFTSGT
jgi:hypothetical protein